MIIQLVTVPVWEENMLEEKVIWYANRKAKCTRARKQVSDDCISIWARFNGLCDFTISLLHYYLERILYPEVSYYYSSKM